MTIGEKIMQLRIDSNLSQEQLAEKIQVSRQSVSKWEMDQSLPSIDKVLLLSDLFSVSIDELLRDSASLKTACKEDSQGLKYFGTDGFRGEANVSLTSMQAYKVGRFLGWYFGSDLCDRQNRLSKPKIVIGKDTRRSSYMLEYSIVAGITASGADAYLLHVTTTPSISFVTRQEEFDCGIMITASHNPYYDNGIKIVNRFGEKLDNETAKLIEYYLDGNISALSLTTDDIPLAIGEKIGCIIDYVSGRNRYLGYLISLASNSYKNLRIGLDSANGASWMIAKSVFEALGAKVYLLGAEPNGININRDCGSTHIENLSKLVREKKLDFGFAFDGDADRCIAVDEDGNEVDGDKILYILGKRLKDKGILNKNTVVCTIMSNSGLKHALKHIGIDTVETTVGDRFVYECMQDNNYSIGGEKSGHIILKKYATTGDGILTAIMLTEEVCESKCSLKKLGEPVKLYPQYMVNIKVRNKKAVTSDSDVLEKIKECESEICGKGRVLLRESGTEPLIRVMVECEDLAKCRIYAHSIEDVILGKGYGIE